MQNVLITGAGRGLGRAMASAFAKKGYGLVLNYRALNAERQFPDSNEVFTVYGDLRYKGTILRLKDAARLRGVNILVNNVGVYLRKSFLEMGEEEFREVMETNFTSTVLLTKELWPVLVESKNGLIININSLAGRYGGLQESAYAASKHALVGFFDSLHEESIRDDVRVMNVFIGAMKTDMTKHRQDWDQLIDPTYAAHQIVDLCKLYPSLAVTDIEIRRTQY